MLTEACWTGSGNENRRLGHVFRNEALLQEITERRTKGKALRGRKKTQC